MGRGMCIGKTLGPLQYRTGYRYPVLYWKDGHQLLLHRYSWTRRDLYYVIACADAIHQRISISCPVLEAEPWQQANPFETLSAAPRRRWAHRFHSNNISCTRVPKALPHLLMALEGQRCAGLLGRLAPGFLFFRSLLILGYLLGTVACLLPVAFPLTVAFLLIAWSGASRVTV